MALETFPLDVSEYLDDPEAERDYLDAAISTGEDKVIADAIGLVARGRGMTAIANDTGIERRQLYRALNAGRSDRAAMTAVLRSLGVRQSAEPTPTVGQVPVAAE